MKETFAFSPRDKEEPLYFVDAYGLDVAWAGLVEQLKLRISVEEAKIKYNFRYRNPAIEKPRTLSDACGGLIFVRPRREQTI